MAHAALRFINDEARADYDAGSPAPAPTAFTFTMIPDDAFEQAMKLGPIPFTVYAYLCKRANQDGQCWPSYQNISTETTLSRRVVIQTIQKLAEANLIKIERRLKPTGDATSNLFQLIHHRVNQVVHQSNHPQLLSCTSAGDAPKLDTVSKPPTKPTRKSSPQTTVPLDYQPTVNQYTWAMERHGLDRETVERETEQFINHYEARGEKRASWDASWRTWMGNVNKFAPRHRAFVPAANGASSMSKFDRNQEQIRRAKEMGGLL